MHTSADSSNKESARLHDRRLRGEAGSLLATFRACFAEPGPWPQHRHQAPVNKGAFPCIYIVLTRFPGRQIASPVLLTVCVFATVSTHNMPVSFLHRTSESIEMLQHIIACYETSLFLDKCGMAGKNG